MPFTAATFSRFMTYFTRISKFGNSSLELISCLDSSCDSLWHRDDRWHHKYMYMQHRIRAYMNDSNMSRFVDCVHVNWTDFDVWRLHGSVFYSLRREVICEFCVLEQWQEELEEAVGSHLWALCFRTAARRAGRSDGESSLSSVFQDSGKKNWKKRWGVISEFCIYFYKGISPVSFSYGKTILIMHTAINRTWLQRCLSNTCWNSTLVVAIGYVLSVCKQCTLHIPVCLQRW